LLATITLRKIRQKVTFHKALKRSIDREQELPHAEEDPSPQLWALARELSPFINLAFKEES
jgi:hypothetical protein